MALTQGHHLFAGLHEDAINKVIRAFRAARPKYFLYATPPLGAGVPSIDFWILPPLPIPGTNSGMPFSVEINRARVDLHPASAGLNLPAPLTLDKNQFAITLDLQVCFLCGMLIRIPIPREQERDPKNDGRDPRQNDEKIHKECAKLSIWAVGHPISTPNSHGGRDIGLHVDRLVIKDVGALEPLLECYGETMLNTLLDALRYPVERFALGTFASVSLADGPLIADDQLKVRGDIS